MAPQTKRMPDDVESTIGGALIDDATEFDSAIDAGINGYPMRLNGNASQCLVCRQPPSDRCTFCSPVGEKFIVSSTM
jgi:hypothetical protein